jgi:hypothetical protein
MTDILADGTLPAWRTVSGPGLGRIKGQFLPKTLILGRGGIPRNIFRFKGRDIFSWYQYARFACVVGEYGGQLESFEALFSPRGEDGRPMPLFDRDTGAIDPFVQKAWERYDISRLMVANWK